MRATQYDGSAPNIAKGYASAPADTAQSAVSGSDVHYRSIIGQVERRNGEVVDFNFEKIVNAIFYAMRETSEGDRATSEAVAHQVAGELMQLVRKHRNEEYLPTIEQIQDLVEKYLILNDFAQTAKAYILYRDKRAQARRERHELFMRQFEQQALSVRKANGMTEAFDLAKIEKVFDRVVVGYETLCTFDEFVSAFKRNVVSDLQTSDINRLMVKTALDLVTVENTSWQHIAARLLLGNLYKHAMRNRNMTFEQIYTPEKYLELFEEYVRDNLYYKDFFNYYTRDDILEAGRRIERTVDDTYEYTTVLSLSKRYLLNPNGIIKELPQEMYMSVALFLAMPEPQETRLQYAFKLYEVCAKQMISLPTPTLLNSRTNYHQLASCFKLNVEDDLRAIYHAIENVAQISKFGGGVGVYLGNIRSQEASIRGRKRVSGGVNPWIKVINDTGTAVNQLGARTGAVSVTLDIWHRDIYDFLDLQTETGDIRRKAFDIFPAVAVPDIFMRRVKDNATWTLFDPHEVRTLYGKNLQDHFNEEFDQFYHTLEQDPRLELKVEVPAKELFKKFLRTVVETGMPYVFFRDTVNRLNPNSHAGNVYSTQLCTEICQNTSPSQFQSETDENGHVVLRYKPGDTVVCNLASVNIAKVHDEETVSKVMPVLARALDNVITLNYYPIKEAERTAKRYRPIGIGYLGLAEYLATRHIRYNSPEAKVEVGKLFERYGYHTYRASVDLARERGHYELFPGSHFSKGIILGRDVNWYQQHTNRSEAWAQLFSDMQQYGTRFGYHTAPAPNTSTAGVVGTTAALLPIYKRFFVEHNISSPSIRVAPKLTPQNFEYYQEYISLNMNDVIDVIAEIYKWVDQSISFEWMINPETTSPQDLYSFYIRAWEKEIKTVYYVRSLSVKAENPVQEAIASTVEQPHAHKFESPEIDRSQAAQGLAVDPSIGNSKVERTPQPVMQVQPQQQFVIHGLPSDEDDRNICESCSG